MNIKNDFQEILDYAHYWNWAPDWLIVKEIYEKDNLKSLKTIITLNLKQE